MATDVIGERVTDDAGQLRPNEDAVARDDHDGQTS
jgi:hypothetical protein